jgi:hypothetical protein
MSVKWIAAPSVNREVVTLPQAKMLERVAACSGALRGEMMAQSETPLQTKSRQ